MYLDHRSARAMQDRLVADLRHAAAQKPATEPVHPQDGLDPAPTSSPGWLTLMVQHLRPRRA